MLYVVATPIGNLEDISARALKVLRESSLILCEDTRHFGKLAQTYQIDTRKLSFYEQNEESRISEVLELLDSGEQVCLVSDAGTPCISDPGYRLIKACREAGVEVSPVPGACSPVAALSVSGLATDKFTFAGFLPTKSGKKTKQLEEALGSGHTWVFFESPYRIRKTLGLLHEIAPERKLFVAREISKMHEQCLHGTASEILSELKVEKGEFVLAIGK